MPALTEANTALRGTSVISVASVFSERTTWHGKERAGYGEELMNRLAERLATRYGKGFGPRTLRRVRLFYLTFPKGSALLSDPSTAEKWTSPVSKSTIENAIFPPHLGWTHYLVLMRVENPTARAFYEIEATREGWVSRELERHLRLPRRRRPRRSPR